MKTSTFLVLISACLLSLDQSEGQWVQTSRPYGGDIHCLAVHETNLFAGTWGNRVFVSPNSSKSWTALNAALANSFVYALVATDDEASPATAVAAGPSIDGTYRLVYRALPNGTRQVPPAVDGLMTFADGYRSVDIMEHNGRRDIVTLSSVSSYTFTDSLYTEHMHYHIATGLADSEGGGFKTNLDGSSPVSVGADGSISFDLPLDGPHVIFTADSMIARLGTTLIDHWVKLKSVR